MGNKEKLRTSFINTRKYLSQNYLDNCSKIIERKIIHYIERYNLRKIGIFINMNHEPSTKGIINFAIKNNIEVYAPVIKGEQLEFKQIHNLENDLVKHPTFAFLQPSDECATLEDINALQNIFVPLVAFDKHLNRIGFGKGYYDRWFNKHQFKGTKIGICQSSQMSNQIIDVDKNDVAMDLIITEKEIFVPFLQSDDDIDEITYAVFNDETLIK